MNYSFPTIYTVITVLIFLIFLLIVAYFGLNWVADNPKKVKKIRNYMNGVVKQGKEAIRKTTN